MVYEFVYKEAGVFSCGRKLSTTMGKHFHLFENISKVDPFEGPQHYLAPMWAFYLQAAFMGFVLFAGAPLNFVVLLVTAKYKKLRVPLNYILVNISLAGFIFAIFSVSQVFLASVKGYYFLGYTLCAMEAAMGSIAGKHHKLKNYYIFPLVSCCGITGIQQVKT